MLNWKEYDAQLDERLREFAALAPDTVQAYRQLSGTPKALDAKTRELIALAVAVTTRCDGCIGAHVKAARRAGASKAELSEALAMAVSLNAGAALVYSARTLDAFDAAENA